MFSHYVQVNIRLIPLNIRQPTWHLLENLYFASPLCSAPHTQWTPLILLIMLFPVVLKVWNVHYQKKISLKHIVLYYIECAKIHRVSISSNDISANKGISKFCFSSESFNYSMLTIYEYYCGAAHKATWLFSWTQWRVLGLFVLHS